MLLRAATPWVRLPPVPYHVSSPGVVRAQVSFFPETPSMFESLFRWFVWGFVPPNIYPPPGGGL